MKKRWMMLTLVAAACLMAVGTGLSNSGNVRDTKPQEASRPTVALALEASGVTPPNNYINDYVQWTRGVAEAEWYRGVAEAEWYAGVERAEAERTAAASRASSRFVTGERFVDGDDLDRLAQCECGGNPSCNTGNTYYGTFQFSLSTWQSVGGEGYPHEASYEEQKYRAGLLVARSGYASQFPGCSAKLGLR